MRNRFKKPPGTDLKTVFSTSVLAIMKKLRSKEKVLLVRLVMLRLKMFIMWKVLNIT
jgi:hypothetical protein